MTHRVSTFGGSHGYLPFGDERTSERGTQKVVSLIDGIGPEGWKDIIPNEFLSQVLDNNLTGSRVQGLLPDAL